MKRPVEDGFSLLVGAGIGAAVMYLFDPDRGRNRREAVRQSAQSAVESTLNGAGYVQDATGKLVDRAKGFLHDHADFGDMSADVKTAGAAAIGAAKHLYDHLSGSAQDTAAGASNQLRDNLKSLRADAQKKYSAMLNRVSLAAGRDRDHHYMAQTTCAIGSLALGAGLVYFLDPNNGAQRREAVLSCGNSVLSETTEFFRRVGQFFSRTTGQMKQKVQEVSREVSRSVHKTGSTNQTDSTEPEVEPTASTTM